MLNTTPRHPHEEPIQKAARLIAEGRIHFAPHARVYDVEGDHETYRVIVDPNAGIFCPCPARLPLCSHALAVAQVMIQHDHQLPDQLVMDVLGPIAEDES
jgi:hypothetical protein